MSQLQTPSTIAVGYACLHDLNRNLHIYKALLKAKRTSLFTIVAMNQRWVSKKGSREAQVHCRNVEFQLSTHYNSAPCLVANPNMVPQFTDIPQHRSLGLKGQIPASQVRTTSIRENSYAVYLAILQRLINSNRDYL